MMSLLVTVEFKESVKPLFAIKMIAGVLFLQKRRNSTIHGHCPASDGLGGREGRNVMSDILQVGLCQFCWKASDKIDSVQISF
jgi:hypothetical protein